MPKKLTRKQQLLAVPEPPLEEPSAESTPGAQPTPLRPKSTPYTSSPIALYIGPAQSTYYVPRNLLQNPQWIDSSTPSWGNNVYLPDIDEETGHVLIHYLYTGAYETLDNLDVSSAEEVKIEFKRAVLAYVAANIYGLSGLQELAMHQIVHFGADMDIFDIVGYIKADFSNTTSNISWFHDYLKGKAKASFDDDYTVFAEDDFFDAIGNVALKDLLVRWVMGFYRSKVSDMLSQENPTPEVSEGYISIVEDSPLEGFPSEATHAIEDCTVAEEPTWERSSEEYPVEVPVLQACVEELVPCDEPVACDKPAVEELAVQSEIDMSWGEVNGAKPTDSTSASLGVWNPDLKGKSWTFGATTENVEAKDEAKETTKDSPNFVFNFNAFDPPPVEPVTVAGDISPPDDEWWSFVSKSKKKGKKKVATEIIEEPLPEPVPELKQIQEDDWGISFGTVKGKKKKKQAVSVVDVTLIEPAPELAPEPVLEPEVAKEVEDWDWGSVSTGKKKKGKKGVKAKVEFEGPPPPLPEPQPEAQAEPAPFDENTDDPWGEWAVPTKKSKKKKKGSANCFSPESPKEEPIDQPPPPPPEPVLEAMIDEPPPPPPEPTPEETQAEHWSDQPSKATTKEKAKAIVVEDIPPPPPPAVPEPEPVVAPMFEKNEDEDWGSAIWGGSSKKKKKMGKIIEPEPVVMHEPKLSAVPATQSDQLEEETIKPSEEEEIYVSNGHTGLEAESEQPAEVQGDICPLRSRHLLEGDQWRNCRQCRAILHQVAVQLASTGRVDEDEYEIVDQLLLK